jgi:hypothetical protein
MSTERNPRPPLVCRDCGAVENEDQREYCLDCKCGGTFIAPAASIIVRPDQISDADYRKAREILVADASRRGRPQPLTARDNRLPEEISPWSGLEPELAREMAELFPAPNPDIVASRRLRKVSGWGGKAQKASIGLVIPQEILFVTGMRRGDLVLVSGYCAGVIRIVRIPEGENG